MDKEIRDINELTREVRKLKIKFAVSTLKLIFMIAFVCWFIHTCYTDIMDRAKSSTQPYITEQTNYQIEKYQEIIKHIRR